MPQLHLYLPQELADEARRRAEERGISVSAWLAEIVKDQLEDRWPEGYLEMLAQPPDSPIVLPEEQWEFEEREPIL